MTSSKTTVTENDEAKNGSDQSFIGRLLQPVIILFDKILPPYEPRIDIEKKKFHHEKINDHAIIRHFSEVQLLFGILLFVLGIITRSFIDSGYAWFISILGIVLFLSAYELEEIYITSHRIVIRRVGMVERIMRIPSDEDHAINHLVSFQVGRAPINVLLVIISGLAYLIIFNNQISDLFQLVIIITATIILMFGLRINRRAVTLYLAGGLSVILGVRKGVPKRVISAIQSAIYEEAPKPINKEQKLGHDTKSADLEEKPAK